jgi:hypothetical protein
MITSYMRGIAHARLQENRQQHRETLAFRDGRLERGTTRGPRVSFRHSPVPRWNTGEGLETLSK